MGNCAALHEPRTDEISSSTDAVAPLHCGPLVDEATKAQKPQPPTAAAAQTPCRRDKAKLKVHFADDVVFDHSAKKKECVTKVKMVMTKKEAALLLSALTAGDQGALESMLCDLESSKSLGQPETRRRDVVDWRCDAVDDSSKFKFNHGQF